MCEKYFQSSYAAPTIAKEGGDGPLHEEDEEEYYDDEYIYGDEGGDYNDQDHIGSAQDAIGVSASTTTSSSVGTEPFLTTTTAATFLNGY